MWVLSAILFCVVVSVGLLLCATALRSQSVAWLNLAIWLVATFAVLPWSNLSVRPPLNPDARLAWNAAWVWAIFLMIAVIGVVYVIIAKKLESKLPKRRRRKYRSRGRSTSPDLAAKGDTRVSAWDN